MKTIHILDTGCERYTIKSDCSCLGRQWDNIAEELQIVIPEREKGNVCTMIVSADGVVIDHLDIKDEPKEITNALSRFSTVEISFTFTNESGYVKNSEIRTFYFDEARMPEDFVPVEPEQSSKIDILLGNGIVRADLDGNIVRFYNSNGDKVQDLDLESVGGKINSISLNGVPQAIGKDKNVDMKETDPTVSAWAKAPNKPTYSYNELQDKPSLFSGDYNDLSNKPSLFSGDYNDLRNKPTIPSVAGLASETYVNNKASTTLSDSKAYTDKKVSDLVGSAPSTLDTLAEISSALQNNPNVVKALNDAIGTKQGATDNSLQTNSKTIVGAINEINSKISSANTQLQDILGV